MAARAKKKRDFERAVQIVFDAGGRVIGRTKLQKIAYLLEATGLGEGFSFEYRHYGPYSEELASAVRTATLFGNMNEEERPTTWGGSYSIYRVTSKTTEFTARTQMAKIAADADAVELELAATAAFLALEGVSDPWAETAKRKPEKATPTRLENAKNLYRRLQGIQAPKKLPAIS